MAWPIHVHGWALSFSAWDYFFIWSYSKNTFLRFLSFLRVPAVDSDSRTMASFVDSALVAVMLDWKNCHTLKSPWTLSSVAMNALLVISEAHLRCFSLLYLPFTAPCLVSDGIPCLPPFPTHTVVPCCQTLSTNKIQNTPVRIIQLPSAWLHPG